MTPFKIFLTSCSVSGNQEMTSLSNKGERTLQVSINAKSRQELLLLLISALGFNLRLWIRVRVREIKAFMEDMHHTP